MLIFSPTNTSIGAHSGPFEHGSLIQPDAGMHEDFNLHDDDGAEVCGLLAV